MLPLFDRNGRLPVYLRDALDRGSVVLTANLRAARALGSLYAEDQRDLAQSSGATAWLSPRIVDWASWVSQLWELHSRDGNAQPDDLPMPLTAMQEHQLWQSVQGSDRARVVAPDRMAELAQQAYALLGSYSAHPLRTAAGSSHFGDTHEDAERFLAWAAAFDRLCAQNGWISRSRLEETLAAAFASASIAPGAPAELCLVGFDRTTPAQEALLAALEAAETLVTRYHPQTQPLAPPLLVAARDEREELEACAWWCRTQLLTPSVRRIGVIAPDLARVRAGLDRTFCRILTPEATLWPSSPESPAAPDRAMPYEFSLGTSLGALPPIRAALVLLRWLAQPIAAAELTSLFTSGFLAASPLEQADFARFDAELRRDRRGSPEVSLPWLLEHGRRHLPAAFRTRLERVARRAAREGIAPLPAGASTRRKESYAHWAELVPALLAEAGWPGYPSIDSFAYQVQQRFTRLLGELAELGFNGAQPSWNDFLGTLERQAHAAIFAAESTSAPIQILGAFESSGQDFDAVWFLGVDDSHWPQVGRPHPLLPASLQRDAQMPHSTPDTDWLLAQQTTARLVASAPVVVLSYPIQERAASLRASPLALAAAGALSGTNPTPAAQILAICRGDNPALKAALQPVTLESIADDSGTLPWSREQSAGGADILKRQAACAFQSFATRRLHALPLEDAEQGLDARERGTLLHDVLARLWSADPPGSESAAHPGDAHPPRLHTRDELEQAMRDGSILALVTAHVDRVFRAKLAQAAEDPWQQSYLASEQQRVHERLLDWLACERERQPFTIRALETELRAMEVGPLHLRVRPDRIDTLADGSHLLLDYKTGKVATSAWDGERPVEPQLPLYALFGGVERVSGVAFGQIRADGTKLLARAEDPATQVSERLGRVSAKNRFDDEVRDAWREALLALAGQFAAGDARVNPRNGATTCRYCPLAGLCRVHETGGLQTGDAEPSPDA